MSIFSSVLSNLISAGLGALAILAYERFVRNRRTQVLRWFWNPANAERVQIVVGRRKQLVGDEAFEDFLSESDARAYGALVSHLSPFYEVVDVLESADEIDWSESVVSIGGPVSNDLAARLDASVDLPYRFSPPTLRPISSRDGSQTFDTVLGEDGTLETAYALITWLRPRIRRESTLVLAIAGSYGPDTLSVVTRLCQLKTVKRLKATTAADDVEQFQAIARVEHSTDAGPADVAIAAITAVENLDMSRLRNH